MFSLLVPLVPTISVAVATVLTTMAAIVAGTGLLLSLIHI